MKAIFAIVVTTLLTAGGLDAMDYPRWRGEFSNGSAGEPGMPLVQSWNDARVAWVSEVQSAHDWNFSVVRAMSQWPRNNLANGGLCMPAVWQGKVYVHYWRPAGTVMAEDGDGKYEKMWASSGLPSLRLIEADTVIVCMDAATGRTLWETVYPKREMNLVEKYGGHNNLCVWSGPSSSHDGTSPRQAKVYAIGNTGWIYCVDATTGKKVWEAAHDSAKLWEKFQAACVAQKMKANGPGLKAVKMDPPHPQGGSLDSESYNICPLVADGVLVTGEWRRQCHDRVRCRDRASALETARRDRRRDPTVALEAWRA